MISRRNLLKGGAALAATSSLIPSLGRVAHAADVAPKRVLFFFVPNGMPTPIWNPPTRGVNYQPSPILEAIQSIRSEVMVLSGMTNSVSLDRHGASATLRAMPHEDDSPQPSVDQVIAEHLLGQTALRSLQLSSQKVLPCRSGLCSVFSHVSFVAGGVPAEQDSSTSAVFRRLFGPVNPQASVLDFVRADLARYKARASTDDARRLEAFGEGLRSVERRFGAAACAETPAPPVLGEETIFGTDEHIRTMLDLLVLGLQCDRTRVGSYMLSDAGANFPLDHLGLTMGHHVLSHTRNYEEHLIATKWVLDHFVYLINRLADTPDIDGGRLLDNTTVIFCSEFGDGEHHVGTDHPLLIAGGRDGPARGQHVARPGRELADLWLWLLGTHGIEVETFGRDSTGPLFDLG